MEKEKIQTNKKFNIFKLIFLISLLYYAFWIILAIILSFTGIDFGWAMPAMSDGRLMYGIDAFKSGIIIAGLYTIEFFWFIPLYQIIYIISNRKRWFYYSIIIYFIVMCIIPLYKCDNHIPLFNWEYEKIKNYAIYYNSYVMKMFEK